jgi:hypothetical protein
MGYLMLESHYYLLVHNREIITPLENNNYSLSLMHNAAVATKAIAIAGNGAFLPHICARDMKPD